MEMTSTESDLILQTARLIPQTRKLQPAAGSAIAFLRDVPGGTLLVLIEILGQPKKCDEIIEMLVNTLEKDLSKESDESAESRFEAAARELNHRLKGLRGIDGLVGKINAVIALFSQGKLYVTSTGSAEAQLFRGPKQTVITSGLAASESSYFFDNIADGELQIGDQLALVSPALLHQISLTELKSLVNNHTPSAAVAKLGQLVTGQSNTTRTAAIIGLVTTPQLMAMNVRGSDPSEVTLDQPVTLPSLSPEMKRRTAGIASSSLQTASRLGHAIWPFLKKTTPAITNRLKQIRELGLLKKLPLGRTSLVVAGLILVVILLISGVSLTQASNLSKMEKKYITAYDLSKSAGQKIDSGDKLAASNELNQAKQILDELAKNANKGALEKRLQEANRPVDDPTSVQGLLDAVSARLDTIDRIVRLKPSELHNFGSDKSNKSPRFLEILGEKLVAVADTNAQITELTLDGKVTSSSEGNKDIGKVVGITPNDSEDGLFIMTDKPSLWLYNLKDKSFSKQEISLGSLVKGSAISSYNGNVYVLTETGVFKHTPTLSGFSTPSPSIRFEGDKYKSASALAIDGAIYVGGGSDKLVRFIAGAATHRAGDLPDAFQKPSVIRPIGDNYVLILSETKIAELTLTEKALEYKQQLTFQNAPKISSFVISSGTIYALVDKKLQKASVRL